MILQLISACKNNLTAIAKEILVTKKVDFIDFNEGEALRWACYNDNIEIVKFLLAKGADINVKRDHPIYWAINNNNIELVKLLLDNGAILTNDAYEASKHNIRDYLDKKLILDKLSTI